MKFILGRLHRWLRTSVVGTCLPFTKIVGLHSAVGSAKVVARPFPVNLIQIIRHHDSACDDTRARSRLDHHFDMTKKNVEARPNIRCIVSFGKSEIGTVRNSVRDCGSVGKNPVPGGSGLLSEIDEIRAGR